MSFLALDQGECKVKCRLRRCHSPGRRTVFSKTMSLIVPPYPPPRFTKDEPEVSATVRRGDQAADYDSFGLVQYHYLASQGQTDGDYGLYRVDLAPHAGGPGPHFHRAMSEAFFVLSGAMKLYDGGRAPNPRRVRIFLAEKHVTIPTEPVDLGKLQQRSDAYTAVNPMQRVPALVLDDGTVIAESIAICRYFEALQPDPPLFGRGALESALVEMWSRRVELHLFLPVATVFQHLHPAMKIMVDPQVAAWGEANKPRVTQFLQFLDGELKTRAYVAGEAYTVADITAMIAVDFMRVSKLPVPDDLVHVRRWHDAVSARPSAKA